MMETKTIRNLIRAEIRSAASAKAASADLNQKAFADADEKEADMVFDCLRMEDGRQVEELWRRIRRLEQEVGINP